MSQTAQLNQQHVPTPTTTLPDGTVIPAMAYDAGRSALSVGHVDTDAFLRNAEAVFTSLGTMGDALEAECVIRRHALVQERHDGSVMVLWHVINTGDRVEDDTPGAVPVTLIEI